ncbi:ribosome assembly cofactor RimP [Salinispira pacifica]
MAVVRTEEDLLGALEPVVQGLDYQVVDVRYSYVKGTLHVNLVIFRPEGVSVQGCADVSRTVLPRLEIIFDSKDIYLEVASPGIDRKIRLLREYAIFRGRGVSVLKKDGSTVKGIIEQTDEESVAVRTDAGLSRISYEEIQKSKLDDTQEAR